MLVPAPAWTRCGVARKGIGDDLGPRARPTSCDAPERLLRCSAPWVCVRRSSKAKPSNSSFASTFPACCGAFRSVRGASMPAACNWTAASTAAISSTLIPVWSWPGAGLLPSLTWRRTTTSACTALPCPPMRYFAHSTIAFATCARSGWLTAWPNLLLTRWQSSDCRMPSSCASLSPPTSSVLSTSRSTSPSTPRQPASWKLRAAVSRRRECVPFRLCFR